MMKKMFTAVAVLALSTSLAMSAALPLPASNGPSLGDQNTNIYTLDLAIQQDNGRGSHASLSVSQTSGQANCTQLDSNGLQEVTTSASTGYVCLPTAVSGKVIYIGNGTTQTIDFYTSVASFVSGTADQINGTAGTTAYTGLTSGKSATCFVPHNGFWYCLSGN